MTVAWDPEIELLAQTLPAHLYQALHGILSLSSAPVHVLDIGGNIGFFVLGDHDHGEFHADRCSPPYSRPDIHT